MIRTDLYEDAEGEMVAEEFLPSFMGEANALFEEADVIRARLADCCLVAHRIQAHVEESDPAREKPGCPQRNKRQRQSARR